MDTTAQHTLLVDHRGRERPTPVDGPITSWVDAAIERGQKVLYELEPAERRHTVLESLARDPGDDLELLDTDTLREMSSGTPEGLARLHRSRLRSARQDGWSGLTVVTGAAVLSTIGRGAYQLAAMHGGAVTDVVRDGISALCRYQVQDLPDSAPMMLATHFRDVDDTIWGARLVGTTLRLTGEIDVSNADRLGHVLQAAAAAGLRELDLSDLGFCGAAGARRIAAMVEDLGDGETLVIARPGPTVARLLSAIGLLAHPAVQVREARR